MAGCRARTAPPCQIAARLGGVYHDGNQKQLSSELLAKLAIIPHRAFSTGSQGGNTLSSPVRLGASVLALLPVLLHAFGTRWRPGLRPAQRSISGVRGEDRVVSLSAK